MDAPLGLIVKESRGREVTSRLPHHPFHQVNAGDFFRHAMFDLQAGIDLEKIKLTMGIIENVFNCAGRLIVDGFTKAYRRVQQRLA